MRGRVVGQVRPQRHRGGVSHHPRGRRPRVEARRVHVRVWAVALQRHERVAHQQPVRAGVARAGRAPALSLLQHVDVPPAGGQLLDRGGERPVPGRAQGVRGRRRGGV